MYTSLSGKFIIESHLSARRNPGYTQTELSFTLFTKGKTTAKHVEFRQDEVPADGVVYAYPDGMDIEGFVVPKTWHEFAMELLLSHWFFEKQREDLVDIADMVELLNQITAYLPFKEPEVGQHLMVEFQAFLENATVARLNGLLAYLWQRVEKPVLIWSGAHGISNVLAYWKPDNGLLPLHGGTLTTEVTMPRSREVYEYPIREFILLNGWHTVKLLIEDKRNQLADTTFPY